MSHFAVREPIWNGGKRCVGLAEDRINLSEPYTTFEITYTDKKDRRIYPYKFSVRTLAVMSCPRGWVGVWVRVVPLSLCDELVPANTVKTGQDDLL